MVLLAGIYTAGMCAMWGLFWRAVAKDQTSVIDILNDPTFLEGIAVVGVTGSVVGLSFVGRLNSEATSVILGSVVGYVLGRQRGAAVERRRPPAAPPKSDAGGAPNDAGAPQTRERNRL